MARAFLRRGTSSSDIKRGKVYFDDQGAEFNVHYSIKSDSHRRNILLVASGVDDKYILALPGRLSLDSSGKVSRIELFEHASSIAHSGSEEFQEYQRTIRMGASL